MKSSLGNVLVVKMSAIGDVIHALPVSYAIKETYPDTKITWVVEPPAYGLLTNNPYIDELIIFEKAKFRSFRGLITQLPSFSHILKQGRFDVALDLQGLAKSAAMAYLSKAPKRLGFCNMREGSHLISKPVCGLHQQGSVVERYLDVVRALGCRVDKVVFPVFPTEEEKQQARNLAQEAGLDIDQSYILLVPGANWPNKRWPTQHFARLVDLIWESGRVPVMVGAGNDQVLVDEVIAKAKRSPISLVGKTSLKQLAYIMQYSTALVGGDTGPMHLAAGLKTPVVALMGPTDVNRNGPYGEGHRTLTVSYDCAGCWQRKCPKMRDCLADISPKQVFEALQKIIDRIKS